MGGRACVCWFSRTQKCVTLSLSEAEYVVLGDAANELFLRQVLRFMIPGIPGKECRVFLSLRNTEVLCNSRRTRCRTPTRNKSMFVIIF